MTTGGKIARAGFFLFLGFWVLKGCLAGDPGPPTVILDHTKPWFVKARSPMCQSVADLNALREAQAIRETGSLKVQPYAACFPAPYENPVREVSQDGTFQPDYLVETTFGDKTARYWVPRVGLRN